MSTLNNRAILVLGMHRSGTSVFTGVLHRLGIYLSPHMMAAHADNPSGYWEHEEIVEVHDDLLQAFGFHWSEVCPLPENWWLDERTARFREKLRAILLRDFSGKSLWGLKDPRLCRLLPLWLPLLQELRCEPLFVLLGRNPDGIARSLRKRNDFSESKSTLLWLESMIDAERDTRGMTRALATYESLLADWRITIAAVKHALGIEWPDESEASAALVDQFIQPPTSAGSHTAQASASPWVEEAWKSFQDAVAHGETALGPFQSIGEMVRQANELFGPEILERAPDLQKRLNDLAPMAEGFPEFRRVMGELENAHEALRLERDKKREQLQEAKQELQQTKDALKSAQAELRALKHSLAWKLLHPFSKTSDASR